MKPRGLTVIDRVGQRIGRLIVIERVANRIEGSSVRANWLCQCDCGNTIIVSGHSLGKALNGNGGTRSCGCLMKEKPIKHGMYASRIYGLWASMIQRCTNPKNPAYHSYGGRGITVCDRWMIFENFYTDMGDKPPKLTLDRIDNSKGYSKENCRWATRHEQGNNRRTNTIISFNGKKQTLSQWSKETNLSPMCIMGRLRSGWPIDKALTYPKFATLIKERN